MSGQHLSTLRLAPSLVSFVRSEPRPVALKHRSG
jgi:hypothetical protein